MCPEFSSGPSEGMNRKDFLKLGGIGIAGTALLATVGSIGADAQTGSLRAEFEAAAEEYRVPVDLLIAIGYTNTRLEMPPPDASPYVPGDLHGRGDYGIMALKQNPSSNTLSEASELTGISEERLKTERAANIRGGAALLAQSFGPLGILDSLGVPRLDVVYEVLAQIWSGELYAEQVAGALGSGIPVTTLSGEQIVLGG